MRKNAILPILFAAVLTACSASSSQGSARQLETEVARQLTAQVIPNTQVAQTAAVPTATAQPSAQPTAQPSDTPTETPSPTVTVTPTVTITPTVTPPPEDPALTLGNPSWQDDFSAPNALWPWSDSDYRFEYKDSQFVMTGLQSGKSDSWVFSSTKLSYFYMEMTAATGTCSGFDRFGLVFGFPSPDNNPTFLFRIACNGQYSFGYYGDVSVDYKFHLLKGWEANPHINAGSSQTNRIGLKSEGTKINLFINGFHIAEVIEPTFREAKFGLFAASPDTAGYEVRVTKLAYWFLD
jgi:hypothetical protein